MELNLDMYVYEQFRIIEFRKILYMYVPRLSFNSLAIYVRTTSLRCVLRGPAGPDQRARRDCEILTSCAGFITMRKSGSSHIKAETKALGSNIKHGMDTSASAGSPSRVDIR